MSWPRTYSSAGALGRALLGGLALSLSACGFAPLYGERGASAEALAETKTLTTRNYPFSVEIGPHCSDLARMRLSNLADYAVVTMHAAARHCGGGRTSAAELAAETGLPVPTVQKLVSKLSAAGLLRSVRGAGGGLQLARPAAAISVADIVVSYCNAPQRESMFAQSCSPPPTSGRLWVLASAMYGAMLKRFSKNPSSATESETQDFCIKKATPQITGIVS